MGNLVKAEVYKVINNKCFWGLVILSIGIGTISLLDNKLSDSIVSMVNVSLYNTPMLYFLMIVFAAIFVGEDLENRTLYSFISAGHTRASIFLAKTLVYTVCGVLILALPLILHGIIEVVLMKGIFQITSFSFLLRATLILSAIVTMGMLPLLCAFIFKDIGRTLVVSLAYYFFMIFLLNGDADKVLYIILPMGQLRLLALNELPISIITIIGIDILWSTVFYIGTYVYFYHSDLK